jgi:transposase-like protein
VSVAAIIAVGVNNDGRREKVEPDVLAFTSFPSHRANLHSTNPIERLNGEIERRTEVVFPARPPSGV